MKISSNDVRSNIHGSHNVGDTLEIGAFSTLKTMKSLNLTVLMKQIYLKKTYIIDWNFRIKSLSTPNVHMLLIYVYNTRHCPVIKLL